MNKLLFPAVVILGPILLVALVGAVRRQVRWTDVFKVYLSLLFGGIGLYGHLMHPQSVIELIPPFFPFRAFDSYASGVLELAFAVLIWTRYARLTGLVIIAYLVVVLPFNIYGWTIASNTPSYVNSPTYLWIRVPMQAVFIAFAWFGTLGDRAKKPSPR